MKIKAINTVVFCLILLSSLNGIAQGGPGSEAGGTALEGDDTIGSPINDYIIPMLLLGAVLGFSLLKKEIISTIKVIVKN
jgi:hypothetical protein